MDLNLGLLNSSCEKGYQMSELPVSKITIGPKLRKLRQNLNLNQADMAAELGISASYLNLLENNSRPITVPLLFKLGQTYDIDLREIAEDDSAKLIARLAEVFSDPALKELRLSRRDIQLLANQHSQAAQTMIGLFELYETMRDAVSRAVSGAGAPAGSAVSGPGAAGAEPVEK